MVTDILSLAIPGYYRKRYEQAKFARLAAALDCSSRAVLVRGWSWYGHGMFIQEELRGMYIHISYTHIHIQVYVYNIITSILPGNMWQVM